METTTLYSKESGNPDAVQIRNRIFATIVIASKCNQPVTCDEIALMLPQMSEELNVEQFIKSDSTILKQITIQQGFIVLKGYENLFQIQARNKRISNEKMQIARSFTETLLSGKSYFKILAVCGSVAYETASESDDIDLFIVTQEDRMWIAFAKALLKARIMNMKAALHGKTIDFCLSYVQDEKNFKEERIISLDSSWRER